MSIQKVPTHVAIIPDGNRRWAKGKNQSSKQGHTAGADTVVDIVKAAKEMGIKVMTFIGFTTENWRRSPQEVDQLFSTIQHYLSHYQQKMIDNKIRLRVIGNLQKVPPELQKVAKETMEQTAACNEFDLVLAINYGGRDELVRATKKILADVAAKKVSAEEVCEELLSSYLDTHHLPDPDLLIRTSGENRISNFLLWQSSYAEIYIEEEPWPDFTPQHLRRAIYEYQTRKRRFGGETA